jgi:isocitrate dehydrogenase
MKKNEILNIVTMPGDGIGVEIMPKIISLVTNTVAMYNTKHGTNLGFNFINGDMGKNAYEKYGDALPFHTLLLAKEHTILFKGPTEAPTGNKDDGTPHTSANVALRKAGDYYVCVRPVYHLPNVPTNFKKPDDVNWVIFRENSEGLYGMPNISVEESKELLLYLKANSKFEKIANAILRDGNQVVQLGTISENATKRLMRSALNYAIANNVKVITLLHKNNIFKTADGMFTTWCKEVVEQEFADKAVRYPDNWKANLETIEKEYAENGKIIVDDSIIDAFFEKSFATPQNYSVLVTENFKGDIVSDFAAGLIGGLGVAPGSNNNFENGKMLLEATHGTAPDRAGKNQANPSSMLLSFIFGLEQVGRDWAKYATTLKESIVGVYAANEMTGDLARNAVNAKQVSLSVFMNLIEENFAA